MSMADRVPGSILIPRNVRLVKLPAGVVGFGWMGVAKGIVLVVDLNAARGVYGIAGALLTVLQNPEQVVRS